MRPTFNRQEELIQKRKEFVSKTDPLYAAVDKIHETCLVKMSLNPKDKSVDYELADGADEIIKKYYCAIREIHYQIYGLKMEFI
jgi:hypothetical protein